MSQSGWPFSVPLKVRKESEPSGEFENARKTDYPLGKKVIFYEGILRAREMLSVEVATYHQPRLFNHRRPMNRILSTALILPALIVALTLSVGCGDDIDPVVTVSGDYDTYEAPDKVDESTAAPETTYEPSEAETATVGDENGETTPVENGTTTPVDNVTVTETESTEGETSEETTTEETISEETTEEGSDSDFFIAPECESDEDCLTNEWCPTDTDERRCAPNPSVDGVEIPFQWVPGGTFTMGSPEGELGRSSREAQVEVELTRDYFVQRTPVTQGQWASVMDAWNALPSGQRTMSGWSGETPEFGTSPSFFGTEGVGTCKSGSCPVERVSWWGAVVFANVLSLLDGLEPCYELSNCSSATGVMGVGGGCNGTNPIGCFPLFSAPFSCEGVSFTGKSCSGYRLLTEAEWERAARAGTTTATYNGNLSGTSCEESLPVLDEIAWYNCNNDIGDGEQTQPVGQKEPNAWGLYDMLGNVAEWTWTQFADEQSDDVDPLDLETGSRRVLRGGSWERGADNIRSASRDYLGTGWRQPRVGFRLARTAH